MFLSPLKKIKVKKLAKGFMMTTIKLSLERQEKNCVLLV